MCDCPGMILGLSIVAALLFVPFMMALWYCRRDILPQCCIDLEDRYNQKHENKGRGKLDLKPGKAVDTTQGMDDSFDVERGDRHATTTTTTTTMTTTAKVTIVR
jgi:hypothetical protein